MTTTPMRDQAAAAGRWRAVRRAMMLATMAGLSTAGRAQAPGTVAYDIQITAGRGGFTGAVDIDDMFGYAVTSIGDLDRNGVSDIVVGALGDDDGPPGGALWVLFLDTDSSVASFQKISATAGGFGTPPGAAGLGAAIACLGDLDGDGVVDLAAGMPYSSVGSDAGGAVWILFLKPDGTVKSLQPIGPGVGGFHGTLAYQDDFGAALSALGDIDGDGVMDLAVGASGDDGSGFDQGALWILFLNRDGTVKSEQKIGENEGGFGGLLEFTDYFGCSVATLDDLDGDGVPELAVGEYSGPGGASYTGVVWVLFLAADGTVKSEHQIGAPEVPDLVNGDLFGYAVSTMGDLNGDGRRELAVGAPWDGFSNSGCVRILFLDESGQVTGVQKISQFEGGFGGTLSGFANFGWSLAYPGDLDGDGTADLVVGAPGEPSLIEIEGDAWLLFLVHGPWTWLGHALAGTFGTPSLVGAGSPLAGESVTLDLTHAPPSSATTLVIGTSALFAPFKGGVLVPLPTALVPAVTDAGGAISLSATWPAGLPPGLTIYLQYWSFDVAAPHGFAASNAVSVTTP
ncbi:MAG TPA: FG-GAP-like repeat-containing protein [Planctomycetota bacterium]|nr:FG-GAP-like repeat-containing protein [Planctomycetota bacterium]